MDGNNYQDNTNIQYQAPVEDVPNKANGLQIGGLVCGILAICFSCCYGVPGVLLGVAGLICGIVGNKKGKTGVGTAAIICSIIGLILGVIMLIYFVFVGVAVMEMMNSGELNSYMEMMNSGDMDAYMEMMEIYGNQ